jgi:hypothetical protein
MKRFDLDIEARERARQHASRLAHDVGKYIARIAHNLPRGGIASSLVRLMEKDLFAIDGTRSASQLFNQLAEPLESILDDERITSCRIMLEEIDSLKTGIQNREPEVIRRAAALAVQVEDTLRELYHDLSLQT